MTTITKEEVKAFIEQIESDLANGWEAQIFELKLARIALASLEAEPIGAFHIADQLVGGTS
ncbi:molecular chaperone DnaJ, partial [Salmonella enterica subsp. enterica serovar Infantis]|nr:molecular chaperone DnaJ [Salmonella enterica subsp. enterica serovar Infantis]EDL3966419.1 molecular chaperone DnaJ [Salmonella enterica subsp. enterica serovar Infantis]EDL8643927.1 molecular chaperone DnaJ [Salmonella enterica subsp. enterica serovar Infantis]